MAKLCTLFSGSTGNSTYLSAGGQAVLVDVGVSCKQLLLALEERGLSQNDIKGIFITHTHTDHIGGLRVLLKKLQVPVYASKESLEQLLAEGVFNEKSRFYDIEQHTPELDMGVTFFRTSHDCPGSGGFTFTLPDGQRVGVCTDLGHMGDEVRNALEGCSAMVLESNHDVGMLQNGLYPFETKQRILSDRGHLSNVACATELPNFVRRGTTSIVLAHLSRDNNTPELAEVTANSVLMENSMKRDLDYRLTVAPIKGGRLIYI